MHRWGHNGYGCHAAAPFEVKQGKFELAETIGPLVYIHKTLLLCTHKGLNSFSVSIKAMACIFSLLKYKHIVETQPQEFPNSV